MVVTIWQGDLVGVSVVKFWKTITPTEIEKKINCFFQQTNCSVC